MKFRRVLLWLSPVVFLSGGIATYWSIESKSFNHLIMEGIRSRLPSGVKMDFKDLKATGFPLSIGVEFEDLTLTTKVGAEMRFAGKLSITKGLFGGQYHGRFKGQNTLQLPLGIKTYTHGNASVTFEHMKGSEPTYALKLELSELKEGTKALYDHLTLKGQLNGDLEGASPIAIATSFKNSQGSIELDHLLLKKGSQSLSGSGTLVLDENLQINIASTLETKDWSQDLFPYMVELPKTSSGSIPVTLQGKTLIVGDKTHTISPLEINWEGLEGIFQITQLMGFQGWN